MRKVLLATTALVAAGGVSAASADVSISGGYEAAYVSTDVSGGSSVNSISGENFDYSIAFSNTLDNGMSVAGTVNTSQTGVEETGATISGDFGTIGFGPLGESMSGFATAVDVTPDEGTVTWVSGQNATQNALEYQVLPADESIGDPSVTYTSPAMGGFSFAVGRGDGGTDEQTYYGLKFATEAAGASITLKYATMENDTGTATTEVDASSLGVVIGVGNATVTMATNEKDTGNTVTESMVGTGVGIAYTVSDSVKLTAYSASGDDDKDSAYEMTDTGVGISYTVTPGMVLHLTHNDQDLKNSANVTTSTSASRTSVNLNITF
tara:strand:- start:341 stop:1309 length:969 start_codon:yes stop_codon:yes gene_type:complete